MSLMLERFKPRPGVHCETSTLGMLLSHAGLVVSEAMLLGLGEGLAFGVWPSPEPRRVMPILSGRISAGRITSSVAGRLGITIIEQEADTPEEALAHVEEILRRDRVAGLKLDIYYLDYFKSNKHFAAHYVAMHGMDERSAFVVDTAQQGGAHRIPLESLSKARDSREGFQPSRNLSMYVEGIPRALLDTQGGPPVTEAAIWQAIRGCAERYLSDPAERCGALGMQSIAREMKGWPLAFDAPREIVTQIGQFWRFAGTGGANFRHLYRRFLEECEGIAQSPALRRGATDFDEIAREWDDVIDLLLAYGRDGEAGHLEEGSKRFERLAELESTALARLLQASGAAPSSGPPSPDGAGPAGEGPDRQEVETVCRMCHGGCGAIVTLEGGVPVGIRGDAASPISEGYFCVKGKESIGLLGEHRLTSPLKRISRNGRSRFEPISWSEAMDLIVERIQDGIHRHGPESVVLAQGTDRNYQEWVFRFANVLGTPNVVGPAHVCFYPRVMASIMTFGGFTFSDYEGDPQTVLLWGSNKLHTHSDGVIGIKLARALKRGAKLIVVDPYRTSEARQAEIWLPIRPGTDGALALGMLHLVIENGWYDREFVEKYTSGFDRLREHVRPFTAERTAELTGLAAEDVLRATELYATSARATIEAGTGVSQNRSAFDTLRSIFMLSCLCGNLDAEGGDVIWDPMPVDGRRSFPLTERLPAAQHAKRLGGDRHRLLSLSGWAHPDAVWDAILTRKPYPITSLLVFGSNLLASHADTPRVQEALSAVELLVVCDLFLTPTARMADIILPASSWLERDQVVEFNAYVAARRKLVQVGDCKSDEEVILELAARLGLSEHFWPSVTDALDHKLAGLGHDWASFKEIGLILNTKRYHKYRERGFRTPSGRVNLYHPGLERMGYSPLPVYTPIGAAARGGEPLPYILTSGHSRYFYNSEYHQVDRLRQRQPRPLLTMHPEAAAREGIHHGDRVSVRCADRPGTVELEARVSSDVPPDVVYAEPCWWYPEADTIAGALRSSINALTGPGDPDPQMGSNNLRGFRVSVSKADNVNDGPINLGRWDHAD